MMVRLAEEMARAGSRDCSQAEAAQLTGCSVVLPTNLLVVWSYSEPGVHAHNLCRAWSGWISQHGTHDLHDAILSLRSRRVTATAQASFALQRSGKRRDTKGYAGATNQRQGLCPACDWADKHGKIALNDNTRWAIWGGNLSKSGMGEAVCWPRRLACQCRLSLPSVAPAP